MRVTISSTLSVIQFYCIVADIDIIGSQVVINRSRSQIPIRNRDFAILVGHCHPLGIRLVVRRLQYLVIRGHKI